MEVSKKKLQAYYEQAVAVSRQSPDEQTKVGALLIHGKTGAVISTGYNGFVRGGPDATLPKTRPNKHKYIIHAEINLLCNCARHGISTDDCFVYSTLSPCINCLRALYQSGIYVVYFKNKYRDFNENEEMKDLSLVLEKITDDHYKINVSPRSS